MTTASRRLPSTERGTATYERLLQAGSRVFGQRGFRQASVAEICRRSRVANGTFYQYFPDKERLFLTLVERLTHQLQARLEAAADPRAPALLQIQQSVRAHLELINSQKSLYRVFRETEFLHPELSQRLYGHLAQRYQQIVQEGQDQGQLHRLDPETIAFSIVGLTEFIALRYCFWDRRLSASVLRTVDDFLAYGLSGSRFFPKPSLSYISFDLSAPQRSSLKGRQTRERLLEAAEHEFGHRGFYEAQIADIARRAGVAHGTFYRYFPSKEAIFTELVHEINAQLRAQVRAAIAGLRDRRAIEYAGFRAFLDFIRHHPRAYRIVREAEFVGPPAKTPGRWYYQRLAQGYAPALAQAMSTGQIRPSDPEALSYILMGIGHFIGLRWIVWAEQDVPAHVFDAMMDFILGGLTQKKHLTKSSLSC
ncbi:MAG: TetR/AcrR family transcriptional regulator [Candidatus Bipolaricaulota bacterium]|nr:TetR/AcrR family transcriptional regulator [Candidatus Bipolaricaulota bacterium]MDW8110608.1 TetR/AcrR family transcriptional regulator [Candidatus Bipolaricaulota bacterium]MDW8329775.1 TetR/AcrR family transcriptional regulator [Candidatus Bipolaricaulota bacterium]